MQSAGSRLKKIRLEKGLTLEDVQKKTRIQLNILKAIEEDSLASLNPIYIKGFLKIYCKFLGVEPREYISDYKETPQRPRYIVPKKPQVKTDKIFLSWLTSLAAFVQVRFKLIFGVILIIIFVFVLFNLGKKMSAGRQPGITVKKSASATAILPKTAPKQRVDKPKSVKLQNPAGVLHLGIRAKEDCFIQLKIDGKLLLKGILKKGRQESWQAKEKIEFLLGNAKAVEITVNGERILSLGRAQARKGQVNVVVDKNGVVIK